METPFDGANCRDRLHGHCVCAITSQLQLGVCGTVSPGLVCIDLQPYGTTQAPDRADMLNIGGCSDAVFQVGAACLREDPSRFVAEVESMTL